jgi:hypothetical protein
MANICPDCGKDINLVGIRHNCVARSSTVEQRPLKPKAAGSSPAAPAKPRKNGRPRIEDVDKTLKAKQPWVALKMSERTWYRRQKEKGK